MSNCKKCFFCGLSKTQVGFSNVVEYNCFLNLDGESRIVSIEEMKTTKCENFGGFKKAKEIWEDKDNYNWKSFGKDKRTAHYKSSKKFQMNGADKYLTIFEWNEFNYFDGDAIYAFWHEKALVHYEDGTFKTHKFRSIKNGKCGSDL